MNTDELISAYLDGTLDEAGGTRLKAWLKESPENMRRFAAAALFDQQVRTAVHSRAGAPAARTLLQEPPRTGKATRWLTWRPLAAAAAGLVIGCFSASVVWAYAAPLTQAAARRTHLLFSEGFEDAHMTARHGFPNHANEWFGDLSYARSTADGAPPANGQGMARLAPAEKRKYSYAYRIVDLAETSPPADTAPASTLRQVEVTAAFLGSGAPVAERFQIRLAAFAEAPEEIRPIWNDEATLFDRVLQHVGRNEVREPGSRGWQPVKARMEIPAGTRSLVIALAAAVADDAAPKAEHFLDDVQARLITTEATP